MSEEAAALNFGVKVGRAKRVIRNGKEWFVAPASLINPGVLEGSKGKLYYPADHVSANVSGWDELPLTLHHPESPDGKPVSASAPGVLDRQGIGFSYNSEFDGKLKTVTYFDIDRIRDPHPQDPLREQKRTVYHNLEHGIPIELSTGLYTNNVPAPAGSNHKGRPYDFVATDYRPDHIAILPDQVGACSINDGCGVLVNQLTWNSATLKPVENDGGDCGDSTQSLRVQVRSGAPAHADSSVLDHESVEEGGLKLNEDEESGADFGGGSVRSQGGMTDNAWTDDARAAAAAARIASRKASEATTATGDRAQKGRQLASEAFEHVKAGQKDEDNSKLYQAADAHANAGAYHRQKADDLHERANGLHRQAAEAHGKAEAANRKLAQSIYNASPVFATIQRGLRTKAADRSEAAIRLGSDANQSDSPAAHRQAAKAHKDAADLYAESGAQHSAEQHSKESIRHVTAASLLENASARNEGNMDKSETKTLWQKLGSMLGFVDNAVRKTDGGAPFPGKRRPAQSPAFEGAKDELTEYDAPAELVGTQVTHDGRVLAPVEPVGQPGIAGAGDEDDHQPGTVFDMRVKADKKTGWSTPVQVGNEQPPLLTVTNTDGSSRVVVNPAVSESQRHYLNFAFGHDWVKAHGYDNKGELPEEAGSDKTTTNVNPCDSSTTHRGEMTENFPQGDPMPTDHEQEDPKQASKQAAHASLDTGHDKAFGHAQSALNSATMECHDGAADSHGKAASAHESAATKSRRDDDPEAAKMHDNAAALHRQAASMHKATMNASKAVVKELPPMEEMTENCTFLASLAADGSMQYELRGPWAAKERLDPDSLPTLTANCSKPGEPMTSCEKKELRELAANADPKTKKRLQALLAKNAKEDPDDDDDDEDEEHERNAGESTHSFDLKPGEQTADSGTTQAGGKGTKEEYELSGNKLSRADADWLASAPPTVRRLVQNQIKDEREKKLLIINRLLTGVTDNAVRNRLGNRYLNMDLEELKDELAIKPAHQTLNVGNGFRPGEEENFSLNFLGAAGGPAGLFHPRGGRLTENERKDVVPQARLDYKKRDKEGLATVVTGPSN